MDSLWKSISFGGVSGYGMVEISLLGMEAFERHSFSELLRSNSVLVPRRKCTPHGSFRILSNSFLLGPEIGSYFLLGPPFPGLLGSFLFGRILRTSRSRGPQGSLGSYHLFFWNPRHPWVPGDPVDCLGIFLNLTIIGG